jgi:hypothetical protein
MLKLAKDRIAARYIPKDYALYRNEGDNVVYASWDSKHAIAYRGKAGKPTWHYAFRDNEEFLKVVNRFFDNIKEHEENERKAREAKKNFKTALKPGDILHTSWGYDQTNVEFYQVLTVKNNTVTIQEICQHVEGSDGLSSMAGYTTPIPNKPATYPHYENGEFVKNVDAPILTKRVGGCDGHEYVKINGSATAWKWGGKKEYVSWYA